MDSPTLQPAPFTVQTIAFVLANVDADKGAEVLQLMAPHVQEQVIERVGAMETIPTEQVQLVANTLGGNTSQREQSPRVKTGGVKVAADLLNWIDKDDGKELLKNLEKRNPKLGGSIRQRMFRFEDLVRLSSNDVAKITKEVDQDDLILAMKNASHELKKVIYATMSKRAVEALEEQLEFLGPKRLSEVESAQDRVIQIVRELRRRRNHPRHGRRRRCRTVGLCAGFEAPKGVTVSFVGEPPHPAVSAERVRRAHEQGKAEAPPLSGRNSEIAGGVRPPSGRIAGLHGTTPVDLGRTGPPSARCRSRVGRASSGKPPWTARQWLVGRAIVAEFSGEDEQLEVYLCGGPHSSHGLRPQGRSCSRTAGGGRRSPGHRGHFRWTEGDDSLSKVTPISPFTKTRASGPEIAKSKAASGSLTDVSQLSSARSRPNLRG